MKCWFCAAIFAQKSIWTFTCEGSESTHCSLRILAWRRVTSYHQPSESESCPGDLEMGSWYSGCTKTMCVYQHFWCEMKQVSKTWAFTRVSGLSLKEFWYLQCFYQRCAQSTGYIAAFSSTPGKIDMFQQIFLKMWQLYHVFYLDKKGPSLAKADLVPPERQPFALVPARSCDICWVGHQKSCNWCWRPLWSRALHCRVVHDGQIMILL